MKKYWLILFFLFLTTWQVSAAVGDSSAVAEHNSRWLDVLADYRQNPAFMNEAYRTSYTELGLVADYRHESKALVSQLGTGHFIAKAYVDSYLKLGIKSTVWGGASYRTGERYNIRFCSTSDYALLYPYVMADTVGGNLKNEQYAFFGGYSFSAGKWSIGAALNFRAEHEFRMTDPRPRGIATDLRVSMGASIDLRDYKVGVDAGGNIYKQTNDVQFYNELGVKPEYHMTGLGTHYLRFAGGNRICYYKGLGFMTDLNICPKNGNGAYLSTAYRMMPYEKILTELNALPISTLYVEQICASAGWKHGGKIGWSTYGGLKIEFRNGDEHIAGSASGTEFQSLITLTMYRNTLKDFFLGGAMHVDGRQSFTAEARVGRKSCSTRYTRVERIMEATGVYAQAGIQQDVKIGQHIFLVWNADVMRMVNKTSRHVMPYAMMSKLTTDLCDDMFAVAKANYTDLSGLVKLYFMPAAWKGTGAFVAVKGCHRKLPDRKKTTLETIVGIAF